MNNADPTLPVHANCSFLATVVIRCLIGYRPQPRTVEAAVGCMRRTAESGIGRTHSQDVAYIQRKFCCLMRSVAEGGAEVLGSHVGGMVDQFH
jgi:hypothetical protein